MTETTFGLNLEDKRKNTQETYWHFYYFLPPLVHLLLLTFRILFVFRLEVLVESSVKDKL